MQTISLKSIKWTSVRAVFRQIADAQAISRADISEKTGLSLMTVGKVADALSTLGIVRQVKQQKNAAGRRSGMLSLNPDRGTLILDLSEYAFTMLHLRADLLTVKEYPFAFNRDFTFSENLSIFLKGAAEYLRDAFPPDHCLGIGVSLPFPYDEGSDRVLAGPQSSLAGISLGAALRNAFPGCRILIEEAVKSAATSNAYSIADADSSVILYCNIADRCVKGALLDAGRLLRGAHGAAGNFGSMALSSGRSLNSVIRADTTGENNADEIAKMLHNVILTVDPSSIVLDCELPCGTDVFTDLVKESLCTRYGYTADTLPDFVRVPCTYRHAHRGLAIRLREDDLYRTIFPEDSEILL